MLLFEEYAGRKQIKIGPIKFVKKGFAFFGEKNYLFVIKWMQHGPHPGFYEISECSLEKRIRTIKVNNVHWEEYESFILNWKQKNKIIFDKKTIFFLSWEYFIRKNDRFFSENYTPDQVFPTVDENNPNRMLDCFDFLEHISKKHPDISNFWHNKLSEIISLYCHWLV
jgi:hypothetical protein